MLRKNSVTGFNRGALVAQILKRLVEVGRRNPAASRPNVRDLETSMDSRLK
jgi:hypothetical protein